MTDNELIADFLGLTLKKEIDGIKYYNVPVGHIESYNASQGEFKYHKRWDWLMMAVDKIDRIGFDTEIYQTKVNGFGMYVSNEEMDDIERQASTKLEAVYLCVISFIKWYKSLKETD